MIILLAKKMGMETMRSTQPHGATLENERDFLKRAVGAKKREVWIVEMPGPGLEERLRENGLDVHVLDHHTYGQLDRVKDPATGERKPSSLEQFLDDAGITDTELRDWGYDPKTVRGLGIFDDRFVQGLRDSGYTKPEITAVLDLSAKLAGEVNPLLEDIRQAAEKDWARREERGGYIIIRSAYPRDVRGAISHKVAREGMDDRPIIVSSSGGKKIYVQNVDPAVVDRLKMEFPTGDTFTFGAGHCWGYDSNGGPLTISLDGILRVLEQ
jgi:hypothetical protein